MNAKYHRILVCIAMIAACISGAIIVSATPTANSFGTNDLRCYEGQTCKIPVIINNPSEPVISIIFNVAYNKTIINITDVTNGDLTTSWDKPAYNTNFTWGTRVALVYDGTKRVNSTGSVAYLVCNISGRAGDYSVVNFNDIQLAGTDYTVGTAPPRNAILTVVAYGNLTGRVTDVTCKGIANATISVYDVDLNPIIEVKTNETGYYSITREVGYIMVTARKDYYYDNTSLTNIKSGEKKILDFTLDLKGDLNRNGIAADAGDLAMMKDAATGKIIIDKK